MLMVSLWRPAVQLRCLQHPDWANLGMQLMSSCLGAGNSGSMRIAVTDNTANPVPKPCLAQLQVSVRQDALIVDSVRLPDE